jgi:hypothetical protein
MTISTTKSTVSSITLHLVIATFPDANQGGPEYESLGTCDGGIEIQRPGTYTMLKAAIPLQFACCIYHLMKGKEYDVTRPERIQDRGRWALKRLVDEYSDADHVLLDMSTSDEERLRRLTCQGGNDDTGAIFAQDKNWRMLPKAFKAWEPQSTEITVQREGFRLTFRDDKQRALIQVVLDVSSK